MAFETNGFSPADMAAVLRNNNGNDGFGNGNAWWVILFFLLCFNGGWGGYGGGMYRDDGASYRGYYRDGNMAEKVMSKLREMSQNADPQEKRELEMMMSKLR